MNMELILGICVGALTVLSLLLSVIVIVQNRTIRESLREERITSKSFIRYTHPGAVFTDETKTETKHTSLSMKQTEAMESRGDEV